MIGRLRKRRDFLAAAKGRRITGHAFALEANVRGDGAPPRFGFTVSRRTARSAVERNRIRRRLKEAVRLTAEEHARAGLDYVVVGRRAALGEPFADLKSTLVEALARAAEPAGAVRRQPRRSGR
jgi:ribonuclease P protein component